jgi:hypothetical protein
MAIDGCKITLKEKLAASEKERERFRAVIEATPKDWAESAARWKECSDAFEAERDSLRRELENLKRSTSMTIADGTSNAEWLSNRLNEKRLELGEAQRDIERLRRELDRERAKSKRRGL